VTSLLAHRPLSSLAYPMIIHTPLVAGNLPIKFLVARQWPTMINTGQNPRDKIFTIESRWQNWQYFLLAKNFAYTS
jgi:hypothetical protein